jgi:hypothetical protein
MLRQSQYHDVSTTMCLKPSSQQDSLGFATLRSRHMLLSSTLSKLITSIAAVLERETSLNDPVCFSDSKVSLFWIKGTNHEWKQFVESRVSNIQSLVQPQHWKHCPGAEKPANIPSRGMAASTLAETPLWLRGPHWLYSKDVSQRNPIQTLMQPSSPMIVGSK